MADTTKNDVFQPEILTETVQGAFGQKTAFMGSRLAALGIVVVEGSMPINGAPEDAVGTTVTVPYWGTLGEFEANDDGNAVTPKKIQQMTETATISRDSLAFSVSRWAQGLGKLNPNVGDPYEEATRQIMAAAERAMDRRLITAAAAAGVYIKDVFSSSSPVGLTWDLCIDAKFDGWGDEQDDIAAILVHSQAHKDLLKLKDNAGRPLLLTSQTQGGPVSEFCGVPVVVSDRVPVTGSTMGAVTPSGTSPPVVTFPTNTPLGPWRLVVDCVLGGAHQTAKYRFSTDGGNIWSDDITTPAAATPQPLVDPAVDSRVGVNGQTGLTIQFAAGTFNADNLWTANASMKVMSMLLKRRSLAFWYARGLLGLETDKDIMKHTSLGAMHLYGAAHRYRRLGESSTKPGVIQIVHNVSGF